MGNGDDMGARADDVGARGWLRVRYSGDAALRARAEWALEALMARRRVVRWQLVTDPLAPVDVELRHDASQWEFAQDRAPDGARDPIAATFWWLARVEELLADETHFDEHGRYRYAGSALERGGDPFATPVDELALAIDLPPSRIDDTRREVEDAAGGPTWRIVPTHDIDLPWRWTRVGTRRAMRRVRDELRAGRVVSAVATMGALIARPWWKLRRDDPWNNAVRIRNLELRHGARSTSYVLVDARVPADGDMDMHERGGERYVQRLLAPTRRRQGRGRHSAGGVVGLHGSYTVLHDGERLREERTQAERLAGTRVVDHRFHYLRHRPVDAWPRLAAAGIESDASLGYAEQPGFRAGTAHPFRAWDHARDAPLDLVVIPLAFMDASLDARYLDLSPRGAGLNIALQAVAAVERVGGCASVLWHNDRLCTIDSRGWTRLYGHILRIVAARDGAAVTAREAAVAYRALLPGARS